jgi:phosphate binding protein
MKKIINIKSLALILALVFAFTLTACGKVASDEGNGNTNTTSTEASGNTNGNEGSMSGTISITGSTSVQPLAQDLADSFNKLQPGVKIEVQGTGSTQGIVDATEGTSDIGTSSRDLADEEKNAGLTEHIIAYDGVAVVVHPTNKVTNLTKEQIAGIFKGDIKNWKEVGGDDKEILVISREEGSGTRGAFEELMKLEEKKDNGKISLLRKDALIQDGTGAVKANVASKENAIGYVSLGFVDQSLKKVSVDGVECTIATVKDKSYLISRPFLMLTKGDIKPEVKAFLDYVMGDEGQKIVGQKYITIK